jgi:hypothetical protein
VLRTALYYLVLKIRYLKLTGNTQYGRTDIEFKTAVLRKFHKFKENTKIYFNTLTEKLKVLKQFLKIKFLN